MTIEEAVKILKENKERQLATDYCRIKDMAIFALEKQIAKKPLKQNGYIECPFCMTDIKEDKGNSWCLVCGQKLDWR